MYGNLNKKIVSSTDDWNMVQYASCNLNAIRRAMAA